MQKSKSSSLISKQKQAQTEDVVDGVELVCRGARVGFGYT
jgi:hypothetical protein